MRGLTLSRNNNIELKFDDETRNYYIVWEPIIISLGKTKQEALADLRQAAHFGVDTLIDSKLADINNGKED